MKKYSITKYLRNEKDKEQWTSISDIGKIYDGVMFESRHYKGIEDAYINSLRIVSQYMKIKTYKVKDVYRWKDIKSDIINNADKKKLYPKEMLRLYEKVQNNSTINITEMSDLVRLELREDIGCTIYVPYRFRIFVGYDFMMGVHSSMPLEKIYNDIENLGLHIYEFQ